MFLFFKKIKIHPAVFLVLAGFFFVFLYHAKIAEACTSSNTNYCLLAPLPGLGDSVNFGTSTAAQATGIGTYLNTMIKILIGLMSVLAVIMLVVGGIQYMLSNMAGEKASAKDRMTNAIFGLILALSSYLILNTINPNLVNLKIGIQGVSVTLFDNKTNSDTPEGADTAVTAIQLSSNNIYCPKSGGRTNIPAIVSSMMGKVTYRAAGDGNCPAGQICKDCSGWTSLVETCAGLTPGGGTSQMGTSANKVNSITVSGSSYIVNGVALQDGDVVGWKAGDWAAPPSSDPNGHALLFLGGSLYENHGGTGRQTGNGLRMIPFTYYDDPGDPPGASFTFVYRPN